MSRRLRAAVPLLFALACSAGSSEPPAFGAKPFATVTGEAGALVASFYSAPDPIVRVSSLRVVLRDAATGAPVDGLSVGVVPWMPAMGHGASTEPVVTDQGDGVYVAADVVMPMPGDWQLRVEASGARSDSFVVVVDVP